LRAKRSDRTPPGPAAFKVACAYECGACLAACPCGAVSETAAGVSVDSAACSGCGICASICPAGLLADLIGDGRMGDERVG